MYPVFRPHVKRLLEPRDVVITFADVGSRNGVLELRDLAPWVEAYGFEPNRAEYVKLVSGRTDVAVLGVKPPAFRSVRYFPYALGDVDGTYQLHVTRGPGAVGIREPNLERLREIRWKGRTFTPNFGDDIFRVMRRETVTVRTLESVIREHGLPAPDYLKVDVEGFEYEVLQGAGKVLDDVLLIRVEVCFIPFRKEQKLFSHVDLLLRDRGFDLLHYEVVPGQVGYKEREAPFTIGPSLNFPDRYGQPLSCDAVYVNRGVTDGPRAAALAALLIEKNYLDEALFVLKRGLPDADPALLALLHDYRGDFRTRAVEALVRGYRLLQTLSHPGRTLRWWRGWARLAQQGVAKSAPR